MKDYRGLALAALALSIVAAPLRMSETRTPAIAGALLAIVAILFAGFILFLGRNIEPSPPVYALKPVARGVAVVLAALTLALCVRMFFTNEGLALTWALLPLSINFTILLNRFNEGKLRGHITRSAVRDADPQ